MRWTKYLARYSVEFLARYYGVSKRTIISWQRKGEVPPKYVADTLKLSPSAKAKAKAKALVKRKVASKKKRKAVKKAKKLIGKRAPKQWAPIMDNYPADLLGKRFGVTANTIKTWRKNKKVPQRKLKILYSVVRDAPEISKRHIDWALSLNNDLLEYYTYIDNHKVFEKWKRDKNIPVDQRSFLYDIRISDRSKEIFETGIRREETEKEKRKKKRTAKTTRAKEREYEGFPEIIVKPLLTKDKKSYVKVKEKAIYQDIKFFVKDNEEVDFDITETLLAAYTARMLESLKEIDSLASANKYSVHYQCYSDHYQMLEDMTSSEQMGYSWILVVGSRNKQARFQPPDSARYYYASYDYKIALRNAIERLEELKGLRASLVSIGVRVNIYFEGVVKKTKKYRNG